MLKMASKSVEKRKEGKRNRLSMWEKPECHVRPSGRLSSHRAFGKGRTNVLIKGLGLDASVTLYHMTRPPFLARAN